MNLNPAQQIIQAAAEEQLKQHGMVRLLVLKSRQVGASEIANRVANRDNRSASVSR